MSTSLSEQTNNIAQHFSQDTTYRRNSTIIERLIQNKKNDQNINLEP